MLTQIITILILVLIVGCILYGRRSIKTGKSMQFLVIQKEQKVSIHWIIVAVVRFLLIWLYYSWDIAKAILSKIS